MTATPASVCDSMFFTLSTADEIGVLAEGRDLLRHLIGGEATVLPDDCDHWNIDLRKNIRRRVLDRHHAEQHDQERHHDESVWAAKG